jgi:FkbM family methyltransferase
MRNPPWLVKDLVKHGFAAIGLEVSRRNSRAFGADAFKDIAYHVRSPRPIVLDIGANTGQSVMKFRRQMPASIIHSFEPSPASFRELSTNTRGVRLLHLWNCAIGSAAGEVILNENSNSDLSSVLPLGPAGWGTVVNRTRVRCRTLDEFIETERIPQIDVLKVDTQGYELEVFKGADVVLRSNMIGMVFFEVNFESLYQNLPSLPELFEFLSVRGFRLVSIYDIHHHDNGVAGWGDALFIRESYLGSDPQRQGA